MNETLCWMLDGHIFFMVSAMDIVSLCIGHFTRVGGRDSKRTEEKTYLALHKNGEKMNNECWKKCSRIHMQRRILLEYILETGMEKTHGICDNSIFKQENNNKTLTTRRNTTLSGKKHMMNAICKRGREFYSMENEEACTQYAFNCLVSCSVSYLYCSESFDVANAVRKKNDHSTDDARGKCKPWSSWIYWSKKIVS